MKITRGISDDEIETAEEMIAWFRDFCARGAPDPSDALVLSPGEVRIIYDLIVNMMTSLDAVRDALDEARIYALKHGRAKMQRRCMSEASKSNPDEGLGPEVAEQYRAGQKNR